MNSEVLMVGMMLVTALCPMSLLIGVVGGLLIARELRGRNGTHNGNNHNYHNGVGQPGPVVVNFGDRPDNFDWLTFQPEYRIESVIRAMERDGTHKYAGRTLAQGNMWHLRFRKVNEQLY